MYDRFSFIEQRFLIISSLSDQYGGLILLVLTDNTTHERVLGEVRVQSHGLNERGGPSVPVLRSDFRCMKRLGAWSTTASPLPPSLPPPPQDAMLVHGRASLPQYSLVHLYAIVYWVERDNVE